MVFQDPVRVARPRQTVRRMLDEVLTFHTDRPTRTAPTRIEELVDSVGLPTRSLGRCRASSRGASASARRSPARSPATPSARARRGGLGADRRFRRRSSTCSRELRTGLALSYLVISHDLAVARQIADRSWPCTAARRSRRAPSTRSSSNPRHPYTQELLRSVPRAGMELPRRDGRRRGATGCRDAVSASAARPLRALRRPSRTCSRSPARARARAAGGSRSGRATAGAFADEPA